MLNQVVLVGKLVENPKLVNLGNGNTGCNIKLSITRNFKNDATGEYELDLIPCLLPGKIAYKAQEYTTLGATVGIKGRLRCNEDLKIEIIVEKITFISTKREKEN